MTDRIINAALRGAGLFGKAIFLIIAIKFISDTEYVQLSLIINIIALAVLVCGAEVYTVINRNIVEEGFVTQHQLECYTKIFFINYSIVTPLLFIYICSVGLNNYFLPILLILIFEHISTEITRILIVLSKQITASIIIFTKSFPLLFMGIYGYLAVSSNITLSIVVYFIAFIDFIALLVGIFFIRKHYKSTKKYSAIIKYSIVGLYGKSSFYLISSSLFRIVYNVERFLLIMFIPAGLSSKYIFLWNIFNGIIALIDATILSYLLPKLLESKKLLSIKILLRKAVVSSFSIIFLCAIIACISVYFAKFIQIDIKIVILYLIIIVTAFIQIYSAIYQMAAYSMKNDLNVFISNILFTLSYVMTILLSYYFLVLSVYVFALSLAAAFFIKAIYLRHAIRTEEM